MKMGTQEQEGGQSSVCEHRHTGHVVAARGRNARQRFRQEAIVSDGCLSTELLASRHHMS